MIDTPVQFIVMTQEQFSQIMDEIHGLVGAARELMGRLDGVARDEMLTVEQVAERLGLSSDQVRRMLHAGKLHGERTNGDSGHWRVRLSEITKQIKKSGKAKIETLQKDFFDRSDLNSSMTAALIIPRDGHTGPPVRLDGAENHHGRNMPGFKRHTPKGPGGST